MFNLENNLIKKLCSKCNKLNVRSIQARYCPDCHAKNMRNWRKTNPANDEQRKKSNCRSYTKMLVKRGTIIKGNCQICGDKNVHTHHLDYNNPRNVRWLCKLHHQELHNFIRQCSLWNIDL